MFRHAKILSVDTDSRLYHDPEKKLKRGDPSYVMSSSSLREFHGFGGGCPSRWVTPIVHEDGTTSYYERPESESQRFGSMLDALVLTPKTFWDRYAIMPEDAPRKPSSAQRGARKPSPETIEAIRWHDEFNKETEGKIVISKSELFRVEQASNRLLAHPGVKAFIDACFKQVHIVAEWHDKETGLVVPCQALIDLLPNLESDLCIVEPLMAKTIADLKSSCDARPRFWQRWARKAGYDQQSGWYTDIVLALDGKDKREEIASFEFLIVENYPPWQPARESMTNDPIEKSGAVDQGRRKYQRQMADYCMALKTGVWPSFDDTKDAKGVTICPADPYAEINEQFADEYYFGEDGAEEKEQDPDLIP